MRGLEVLKEIVNNELGICIGFDDCGCVISMNNAAREELDYSEHVYIGNIFSTLFTQDINLPEYLKEAEGQILNTVLYRRNNTFFHGKVRFHRFSLDGVMVNVASVINTDSEEEAAIKYQKAEQAMNDAMKERQQFVANLTHELRTPVNGIKGHINNLIADEQDSDKRRVMDIVLKCCSNMEKIINDMLDFSKIQAGKFELVNEQFNLIDCINHSVDTNMASANEKGIKIITSIAPDVPPEVIGDELRLTQILNNLLSNAIKFTSIGYVSIEVYATNYSKEDVELTFIVVDTGIGISAEEQDKMFKSFSQADSSITKRFKGTGLGLYVTKQLVELMGGNISLTSQKGKGSTFTFTINIEPAGSMNTIDLMQKQAQYLRDNLSVDDDKRHFDNIYVFESEDNLSEIRNNIEKLLLCIEMDNWEKAENFADNIKQLSQGANGDIKHILLKMQMAVRKGDYNKSIDNINTFKQAVGLK